MKNKPLIRPATETEIIILLLISGAIAVGLLALSIVKLMNEVAIW